MKVKQNYDVVRVGGGEWLWSSRTLGCKVVACSSFSKFEAYEYYL